MKHFVYLGIALCSLAAGCSDEDPILYSDVVDLKFTIASGDVDGDGNIGEDKNVNTESGNPYGAFIAAAQEEVGGDPARIVLDDVALTLEANSTNVALLGEVFAGNTSITFETNSGTKYVVATRAFVAADPATIAFEAVETELSANANTAEKYTEIVGGQFKVGVEGVAAAGFAAANASANLTISLSFTAFQE